MSRTDAAVRRGNSLLNSISWLALAIVLLSAALPVRAVPILDQGNLAATFEGGIELSSPVLQTFTVGVSGILTGVELLVTRRDTTTASVTVSIRNQTTVLGSAQLLPTPGDALFTVYGLRSVDLTATPIVVTAGEILTIALASSTGSLPLTCDEWCRGGSLNDPYTRGSYNGISTDRDMAFATYVEQVPEPATLGLLMLALAGALRVRRGASA